MDILGKMISLAFVAIIIFTIINFIFPVLAAIGGIIIAMAGLIVGSLP